MGCGAVLCVQWGKAILFILFLIGPLRAFDDVKKTKSNALLSQTNFVAIQISFSPVIFFK